MNTLVLDILAPGTRYFPPGRLARGLGGNEATLVTWWQHLRARGITVRVLLGPPADGDDHPSRELAADGWCTPNTAPQPRRPARAVIAWRNADLLRTVPDSALKLLYIGDRSTPGLAGAAPACDLAFVGSQAAHARYAPLLTPRHGYVVHSCGHDIDPAPLANVPRERFRCVHASVPERGLGPLLTLWPRLREQVPEATLTVMGGYRLWGYSPCQARALAHHQVPALTRLPDGVTYLGDVDRATYLRTLASSQLMLYPTDYDEMCCIAALEASACGVVPVLSDRAALRERAADGTAGLLVPGPAGHPDVHAAFADRAVALLCDEDRLDRLRAAARAHAAEHTTTRVIDHLLEAIRQCL
ncbi:glycosyltransferase [Kitasatospora sp. NPDC048407]|uniref:glycosyltransferase n=1 Tax=Kitasatospora sp. NPDC048407 TaxID=3364051 RepID=UPI003713D37C